jgi:hypothetical protein
MIPHIVEFDRMAINVHALLEAAQHQQTPHEMKRWRPTKLEAPSCPVLYKNKYGSERTYLRTRSCRICSRNLDGEWRSIIFGSPSPLLTSHRSPTTLLKPKGKVRRRTGRAGDGAF